MSGVPVRTSLHPTGARMSEETARIIKDHVAEIASLYSRLAIAKEALEKIEKVGNFQIYTSSIPRFKKMTEIATTALKKMREGRRNDGGVCSAIVYF